MRSRTKRSGKIKAMLYKSFHGNRATQYGCEAEDTARKTYITTQHLRGKSGLTTTRTGLIISVSNPWLAATPDDRVYDPTATPSYGLAEYKNPYSARDLSLSQACDTIKTFCLTKEQCSDGGVNYRLKQNHDYYYQIQCQLYCDNKEWCDFVVRTNKDINIERIYRNAKWWDEQMEKLRVFYFNALLPELACPRHEKGGIREP